VKPTPVPRFGTFGQTTRWIQVDPNTVGGRYLFDATFQAEGVPADQAQTVPGVSHLATVEDSYASDRPLRIGGAARFVFPPASESPSRGAASDRRRTNAASSMARRLTASQPSSRRERSWRSGRALDQAALSPSWRPRSISALRRRRSSRSSASA
jgi:hypothetical protein